jgi:hypothetical protein
MAPGDDARRDLFDVWGTSSTNVFAAGSDGTMLHYDGATWSSVPTPTTSQLRSVKASDARDVFAVGLGGEIVRYTGD